MKKMVLLTVSLYMLCLSAGVSARTLEEKYEGRCALCFEPLEPTSPEHTRIGKCPCSFHSHCLEAVRTD